MRFLGSESSTKNRPTKPGGSIMKRATIMLVGIAVLAAFAFPARPAAADEHGEGSARLQLVEATIPELQKAMQTELITAQQRENMHLHRIVAYYEARAALYEFRF